MNIPFFGLQRQYQNLRSEILEVTDTVYQSGQVLDGDYTRFFERAIAIRCDRSYAIAVNSCTQGLIFALRTILPENHNVMIPALSFAATVNSVIESQNKPVFCDVDSQGIMDLESVDFALTGAGIGSIMYVNLYGNVVDWDRFKVISNFFNNSEYEIPIIEDAAQSFGASYHGIPSGKLGDVSVLSFDPTKNLPNYGSGGMILTDDADLASKFYDLRDNGKLEQHHFSGSNSKMSEVDCAQMLVKLKYFDIWQSRRAEIAQYYTENLKSVDTPEVSPGTIHAWHKYVIKVSDRHALKSHLEKHGIETRIHYPHILPELPASLTWSFDEYTSFRNSMVFSRESLSLPIYPELKDSEVEHIVNVINHYYDQNVV